MRKIGLLFSKKPQQPKHKIAHIFHCPYSYLAYNLKLISNLQHGLSENPNVPSCSEKELAFLFPDHRAAQITTRKWKHFYGWVLFRCIAKNLWFILNLQHGVHAWTSKCIIMKGGGLGVSLSRWQNCSQYDMEMLAFLWMGHYFRQIANNLWFIPNLQHGLKQHLTASPWCE